MEKVVQKNKVSLDKYKVKKILVSLLPILALVVLFAIYMILLVANEYNISMNLEVLLSDSIVLVLVATGAIFIFTLGQFDISLGANTLFSAVVGTLAYRATGSVFVLFLVCILTAVACSLLNSIIASVFHLPLFVTTIAMLSVLTAVSIYLLQAKGAPSGSSYALILKGDLAENLARLDTPVFKLIILAIFLVVMVFVYDFTKVGRRQKFIGGNERCAQLTGIKISLYGIIAFVIAGVGVGLGSSITVIYAQAVSSATASSIGMAIFIAIVFGGMPISGGARSRIYSALIGGFSYYLMNNILFILLGSMTGTRDGIVQIVSAIIFLSIVFVASINYRSKNLPR